MHARMRYGQIFCFHCNIIKEEDVNINDARRVTHILLAPHLFFDMLDQIQKFMRFEGSFDLYRRIKVFPLGRSADGFCFNNRGAGNDLNAILLKLF